MNKSASWFVGAVAAAGVLTLPASAYQLSVYTADNPFSVQDDWGMPTVVHELGNPPVFPVEQMILSWEVLWTGHIPCPASPAIDMRQVAIQNLTSRDWPLVWYVADDGTTILNDDRRLVGQLSPFHSPWLAFKIDAHGLNTPLVSESLNADGIFEAGEIWEFVLQGYANSSGGPPEAFDSLGIAGASAAFPPSTGSIIVVPEPAWGFVPMALGSVLGILWARRRVR